jgi:uncharacterized protein YjbI with pentapeptide repeats
MNTVSSKNYDQKQFDRLLECSNKKDLFDWNKWRRDELTTTISLKKTCLSGYYLKSAFLSRAKLCCSNLAGADLEEAELQGADLEFADLTNAKLSGALLIGANLKNADLTNANLEGADLKDANLKNATMRSVILNSADLSRSILQNTNLTRAKIEGTDIIKANLINADLRMSHVNGFTTIAACRFDKRTDFTGVSLDAATIDPGLKVALKNNIRRINWGKWVAREREKGKRLVPRLVEWFWWVSDYGTSTQRIIKTFFALAFGFGAVYWLFAMFPGSQSIIDELRQVGGQDTSKAVVTFNCIHTLIRSLYFSIVTLTTLGFGDMHATNIEGWPSYLGYFFLSVQVIIGYVLLGAIVTRLGILFTSEAPAAMPVAAENKIKKDDEEPL